jgi:hypothetical protein
MGNKFPLADFLLNVIALAIVPGLVALVGGIIAAEGLTDTHRRRRIKFGFWILFAVGVATTAWQQYRLILADQGRSSDFISAFREAFPWFKEPQQQTLSKPQPKSSSSPLTNILNERLNEMAKSDLGRLSDYQNEWAVRVHQIKFGYGEKYQRAPLNNGTPGFRDMTPAERAPLEKEEQTALAQAAAEMRTKTKDDVLQLCDLRTEILTNRLHPWQITGLSPSKETEPLFTRLKASNYDLEDLKNAIRYMTPLQKIFESSLKNN